MSLPSVPDAFYWSDQSWGPALRCRWLDPLARHLFTTRTLTLTTDGDWRRAADAVEATAVVRSIQVHGRAVAVVRRDGPLPAVPPEADAIVSDHSRTAVAVRAADCVPLLLADPQTGTVAAVHAGWRGTAAGVARAAIDVMRRECGVDPKNLVAAVGPSIGPCCYEVGSDLVDAFAASSHPRSLIERWFVTIPSDRGDRTRPTLRLDLAGANRDQLILAGVNPDSIHSVGLCTAGHLDLLTSYRAEKARAGRLAALIRARD